MLSGVLNIKDEFGAYVDFFGISDINNKRVDMIIVCSFRYRWKKLKFAITT